MVLEAAEGAEAAQSHAEAIVLPTVLGPREAAPSRPTPPSPARTSKAAACSPPAAATTPWHRWDWAWPSATCPFPGHLRRGRSHLREPNLRPDRRRIRLRRLHRALPAAGLHHQRFAHPRRRPRRLGVDYDELAKLAFASKPGAGGITLDAVFRRRTHAEPPECHRHLLRHDSGQHHTREPGPRLRRRTAVLPARLPGAHPIPGRKASRAFCSSAAARSRSYPHAGTKHSGHGRDPTRHRRIRGHRRGPPGRLGAVRRNRASGMALTIEGVETGEPTEAVYEAYAKARG